MLAWACALGILGLSVPTLCSSKFSYTRTGFRKSADCKLCFEDDCLDLEKARCDYYVETDAMLPKEDEDLGGDEDNSIRREVDIMIYKMVNKATGLSNNMDCIPYVSRYTNCHKENVCLGCKSCTCDPDGRWNCTTTQYCRTPDPPLNIDHRVLVMVMESLIGSGNSKKTKRSITDNPMDIIKTASTVSYEELAEWLYGIKPMTKLGTSPSSITPTVTTVTASKYENEIATTKTETDSPPSRSTTSGVITGTSEDIDYVAFDEVLRNIAVDTKTYNRRKPLDNNNTDSVDFMILDEEKATTPSDVFTYTMNYTRDDVVPVPKVESSTEVVIDLLDTVGLLGSNVTEDFGGYKKYEDSNAFETVNDIIENNALNIMKRDVTGQEKTPPPNVMPVVTVIVNTTNTTNANNTVVPTDLQVDVLAPLNKIIIDKINELENLKRIRAKLLKFFKVDGEIEDIVKQNYTDNTHFSIYNVLMKTGLDEDLRRAVGERYMKVLKRNLIEVIRIIQIIQMNHKPSDIPQDLKYLIHTLKGYVAKNKLIERPGHHVLKKVKSFRRQMDSSYDRCDFISFRDCLVQVIEVIDRDMPQTKALASLSPASRKIMEHVIKTYYRDNYEMPKFVGSNYNLTKVLKNIGKRWQVMPPIFESNTNYVNIYRLKLIHYALITDLIKINEALNLVDLARHSRRMFPSLDQVSDGTIDKITAGLSAIHDKIQIIIKFYSKKPTTPLNLISRSKIENTTTPMKNLTKTRQQKSRSFIKHIRNLLENSKKDIVELLHKKVPKSEIVKQLARKKLNEIRDKRYSQYEETMKKWQNNLKLTPTPRAKRSVLDEFKTRTKSIIPQYLRHKVNPRIKENKKNATASANRKAGGRKNKSKSSKRGVKSRKTTTPKPRKSGAVITPKTMKTTIRSKATTHTLKTVRKLTTKAVKH